MNCANLFDTVYVLFDAYDECDATLRKDILALIRELLSHSSFKIMLTSRSHLRGVPYPACVHLNIAADDDDIRTFLSSRLEEEPYFSQECKTDIVEAISQGAGGM
jgi:hypothetical protein